MSRLVRCLALTCACALLLSCSENRPLESPTAGQPPVDGDSFINPEVLAGQLARMAGWPLDETAATEVATDGGDRCTQILEFQREVIYGDIAHYSCKVQFGPGEHDQFGLHRVVREQRPYRPIRTGKSLFALHGTPGHFEVMFLFGSAAASAPDDQSIAVYLAQHDVDVWGIDQAYTLLPEAIEDFGFMANWGVQFDVDNLRSAMAIARFTRLLTGSGLGKMKLLGYSTGYIVGMAALDLETQLPPVQRHIGGFVGVDYFYKSDDPVWQASECAYLDYVAGLLESGTYQHNAGQLFRTLGTLAETDPDSESPIMPGVTNLQAALIAATMTGSVFVFAYPEIHFFGGYFGEDGLPTGLRFTEVAHYLDWLQEFNFYGPNQLDYEITAIHCPAEDSPFDDHLAEIVVPIYFLGANGGFGSYMAYTATLLGSSDIVLNNVQLETEQMIDFGHVDIFSAGNAEQECWQPVLAWIDAH